MNVVTERRNSLWIFIVAVAIAALPGVLVGPDAWYAALNKPWFNPPNWIFGPVWSVLYVLIAVAAWRVFRRRGLDGAVVLWIVQLAVNASWSFVFFGAHALGLAVVDVLVLLVLAAMTALAFLRRDRTAGRLMVPYVCWVAFASLLAISLYRLN